jgi:5-(carboxyamino)imidazole ribonucleotide synthase
MLAESLTRMNTGFLCLGTIEASPVRKFFPEAVTADRDRFRNDCTVFTLENEFHTTAELNSLLGEKAARLFPALESYAHFADKISQRTLYRSLGIAGPRWLAVTSDADLLELKRWPFPYVLKASQGGYDGKGVRMIRNDADLAAALNDFRFFHGAHLLAEEKVEIVREVAQGFLRSAGGQVTLLPLVETIQENGVCNLVHYPPAVGPAVAVRIERDLLRLADRGLVGIFNFEFFVTADDRVLINEGAPRTHNSQHLTIDAAEVSQFDLLALYLTDPALAPAAVAARPAVMVNILGQRSGACHELKIPSLSLPTYPKLYGKESCSPGRKMGHVTVVDDRGTADLLAIGRKILKEYEL